MKKSYLTTTPFKTRKIGQLLAKKITPGRKAFLIALQGDLGGGKTTFLQGLAKELGIKEKILSPTFIIMRKFKISHHRSKFVNFYHFDCYRLEKPKELFNLGFKKIISSPQNLVAIEWAEKIQKIIPRPALWIKFQFLDKKKRKIVLQWE